MRRLSVPSSGDVDAHHFEPSPRGRGTALGEPAAGGSDAWTNDTPVARVWASPTLGGFREGTGGGWGHCAKPHGVNATLSCKVHRRTGGFESGSDGSLQGAKERNRFDWGAALSQEKLEAHPIKEPARGDSSSACCRTFDRTDEAPLSLRDKRPGSLRSRIDSGSLGYGGAGGTKSEHRGGSTLLFVDCVAKRLRGRERRHPWGRDGDGLPGLGIAPWQAARLRMLLLPLCYSPRPRFPD